MIITNDTQGFTHLPWLVGWRRLLLNIATGSAWLLAIALPLSTALTNISYWVVVICVLLSATKRCWQWMLTHPLSQSFALFTLLFIVGMLYTSADLTSALLELKKYSKYLFIPAFFLVFLDAKTKRWAQILFVVSVLFAVVAYYAVLYESIATWFPVKLSYYGASTLFKNHITMSFLVAFAIYLLALQVLHQPKRYIWLILPMIFLVHYLLYVNVGRTGHLAFVVLALVFGFQYKRWVGLFVLGLLTAIILASALIASDKVRERSYEFVNALTVKLETGEVLATSDGARIGFIIESLKLFAVRPFIGYGTGASPLQPHNEYLYIMVRFGGLGLLVLLWLFWQLWSTIGQITIAKDREIAQGLFALLLSSSTVNSIFSDTTEAHFIIYFVALYYARLLPKNPAFDGKYHSGFVR